ncbi:cholinesterase-like isoform X2 [Schistocerca gregaria]|uniref:cholinesterase-like isoform X2 n=1 Tax=Schistocerca gregaria TaxID=7010 RepID=UPI00211DC7E1|nr:cholinesterase-like isoform X2 [Schistocerca gregaria]
MRPWLPGASTRAGGPPAPLRLLVVVVWCWCGPARCWDELPQTTSGSLRGEGVATPSGRRVLRLLGVRYASAPRRFAAPEPFSLEDTARVVDALDWPPACPQPHNLTEVAYPQFAPRRAPDSLSEDCLFLNVFAPAPAADDEDAEPKRRAVLVWLPGEGLGMADASRYDATLLADRADIVVVTVNYRVGVLGFLSTGSSAAPGNWGALDVLEALRWVRRNAPAVGGDAARVTLAGRAEGAALASLLLAAPALAPAAGEPPLALRFVLQSGVASAWYHIDADPANATAALAASLGCSGPASKAVSCLRQAPLEALTTAAQASGRRWRPVLDGELLSAEPLRAVRRWMGGGAGAAGAALMVGEAAGEGALCLLRHFLLERRLWPAVAADNLTRRDFGDLVAEHLLDFANIRDQSVVDAAVHEYRPWGQARGGGFREAALRFCGLLYGRGRAEQLSRALSKRGATIWRFEMAVRPARSPHPTFMGAVPGDELPALFPANDGNDESDEERHLADEMLHMWANFVKTGNPNLDEDNSTTTQIWPPFVDSSRQMYVFTLNGSRTKNTEFLSRDADFWGTVVPSLLRASLKKGCSCGRKKNQPRMNICTTARCPAISVLIAFTVILGVALVMISYFFLQYIRKSKGLLANEHMPQ